jgi:putative acetyltransferase
MSEEESPDPRARVTATAGVTVTREAPDSAEAAALVAELEAHLASRYPPASRRGFSIDRLLDEGVEFYVIRDAGRPAGCGGILFVDGGGRAYGELKRMYVRPALRGRGLGRRLLDHLIEGVRARGMHLVRLETGIHQHEAIDLYEGAGFAPIPPFGPYTDDPLSRCYELRL